MVVVRLLLLLVYVLRVRVLSVSSASGKHSFIGSMGLAIRELALGNASAPL
jgi:hypothetical protein